MNTAIQEIVANNVALNKIKDDQANAKFHAAILSDARMLIGKAGIAQRHSKEAEKKSVAVRAAAMNAWKRCDIIEVDFIEKDELAVASLKLLEGNKPEYDSLKEAFIAASHHDGEWLVASTDAQELGKQAQSYAAQWQANKQEADDAGALARIKFAEADTYAAQNGIEVPERK